MKNVLVKIFFLVIYSSLAFSMEESNKEKSKFQSDQTSASPKSTSKKKHRKKKKSKNKKTEKRDALSTVSEVIIEESLSSSQNAGFNISTENLYPLLMNEANPSNLQEKEEYLLRIRTILSLLQLMKQTFTYLKSIKKLNTILDGIPDLVKYIHSFKPINKSEKNESIKADKLKKGMCYDANAKNPDTMAAAIQCQDIWDRYGKKINKINNFSSNTNENKIKKALDQKTSIFFRKKIKNIAHKLINSKDSELELVGQWLLFKAIIQKMYETTRAINLKFFKIMSKISHHQILEGEFINTPDGRKFSIDMDETLKKLKIKEAFKNKLPVLIPFLENYIEEFFGSLATLEKTTQFVNYILDKNGQTSSKESAYLINLIDGIQNQFEKNKEYYENLYRDLLQEQKRIFKSVGKRNELFFRQEYGFDVFTDEQTAFPENLFEPENQVKILSSNYIEHAEQFEETRITNSLAQLKKQEQRAKEKKLKKAIIKSESSSKDEVEEEIKENRVEITDDNITSENLLSSLNREVELDLSHYDNRCLCWFDLEFRGHKNPNDLLYHSFPLGMDDLIKQYGRHQDWPNRTHPGQIDSRYYIGGEIQYPDGNKRIVLFAITQDPEGIIYHRGFELKETTLFDEFASNKFEFDFPKIFEEPSYEVKNVICNLNNCEKLTYKINPFCITLNDALNGVNITLFRSSFESEVEH